MAEEPADVVAGAAIDSDGGMPSPEELVGEVEATKISSGKPDAIARPYPRRSLAESFDLAKSIQKNNGGNPWTPAEVAKSLGTSKGSTKFFYLAAAARQFGLTDAGRDSELISLTDLGKKAAAPGSAEDEIAAKRAAFLNIDMYKRVLEYYKGAILPENDYLYNTLETTFGLDRRAHEDFLKGFRESARFAGIGAEGGAATVDPQLAEAAPSSARVSRTRETITTGGAEKVCFVIMPFVERTDMYATGFFTEVFASLFKPAIEAAGFIARTAQRQGSDVIQSTIIKELLDADLVLADLTEHNPNVLFELGVRMTLEKPTVLVRAKGTNPIFDVDNMLRVQSYNSNLWPSTVEKDVPELTAHVVEAWERRSSDMGFIALLSQRPAGSS